MTVERRRIVQQCTGVSVPAAVDVQTAGVRPVIDIVIRNRTHTMKGLTIGTALATLVTVAVVSQELTTAEIPDPHS